MNEILSVGGGAKKRPHLWRKSANRRGWPRLPRRAWFGAAALKQWRAVPLPWLTPALGATAPRMPSQEAPTPILTSTRPDVLFYLVQVAPWKPKTKRWRGCPSDQASGRAPWFLHEKMAFWTQKSPFFSLREPQGELSRPLNTTPLLSSKKRVSPSARSVDFRTASVRFTV